MFRGSMVALVTPFLETDEIDYLAFERLLDMHITAGTSAIVVAGTTGESATLSHSEKLALIRFAVDKVQQRVPIIAGTACQSTKDTLSLTQEALDAGAVAALIMTPAYIKPTQEGLFLHYQAIAKAVPLPIILYNVPSRTASDLLPDTVARLASIPNIIGIKEATGDLSRMDKIHLLCGDSFSLFSGDDATAFEALSHGSQGVISVTANVAPRQMASCYESYFKGDIKTAKSIDETLQGLHHALFLESNPIPTKWALDKMGLIQNKIRLPLTPFHAKYHVELTDKLQAAGCL